MSNKQITGFDADDTLWENEVFFHQAQMKFIELHPHIKDPEEVILQIEKENIQFYGYGIKGFILSLLQASVQFSNNQPNFQNIDKIIKIGNTSDNCVFDKNIKLEKDTENKKYKISFTFEDDKNDSLKKEYFDKFKPNNVISITNTD